jgi:hypothetical protein
MLWRCFGEIRGTLFNPKTAPLVPFRLARAAWVADRAQSQRQGGRESWANRSDGRSSGDAAARIDQPGHAHYGYVILMVSTNIRIETLRCRIYIPLRLTQSVSLRRFD